MSNKVRKLVLPALLAIACANNAYAGDPSARDWIPAPDGTNAVVTYLAALKSHGYYENANRVEDGPEIDVQALIYRQMHYRKIGGKTFQFELIAPGYRTTADIPGLDRERSTGVGDILGGVAVWLHEDRVAESWFAVEGFVTLPTGRYHGSQADVSPGKNRWTGILDMAYVQGIGNSTYLEAVAEVEFFGRNNNYYGETLKKDPAVRLMALASTNLSDSTYVGARYRYETGGREKVNGTQVMRSANSHQLAAEITHQINDSHQVQLQYIHDLKVDTGPKMRGVQLRYLYAF